MSEKALVAATNIQPALRVASASDVIWDHEADIVVIGFGGAGAAAAIEGVERGASVIIVERFDGGGATAFSGGIFYASDTPVQKEAGFQDSAEEMYKYLRAEGTPMRDATLQRFCDQSADNFAWVSRSVPYSGILYPGKATYPPEGKFLYYCGNEKTPKFAAVAKPAPRGHRAVGKGYTGQVFYAGLRKTALDGGAVLMAHAPAQRLIIDGEGAVIGVEVHQVREAGVAAHRKFYDKVNPQVPFKGKAGEKASADCRAFEAANSEPRRIRARGGVVLSTGGFVNNLKLLQKYRPDLGRAYDDIMRLGSMGCDGSGMALGATAGGYVDLMENAFVGKTISPPEAFLHGILVNRQGKRFVNEDAYVALVGAAVSQQADEGSSYLVMSRTAFWRGFWQAATFGPGMFYFWGLPALLNIFLGGTRRGRTIRSLASKIKVDPSGLEKTLRDYDARVGAKAADDLGKLPENISTIGSGPYYAVNMSIRNKFGLAPVFTLGGLRVDEDTGGVLRPDGSIVRGLYAAGRAAVGMCSNSYMSGMSLADLVFSGRRAAAGAAPGAVARAAARPVMPI